MKIFYLELMIPIIQYQKKKYVDSIEKDLKWIGLDWDLKYAQSERLDAYDDAFNYLKSNDLIYRCFEAFHYF